MSNIEWTQQTWNPTVGCTPVSPGCLNCYAATMARRLEAMGKPEYAPREVPDNTGPFVSYTTPGKTKTIRIAEVKAGRAVFTGEVRCVPERLQIPLRRRKPTVFFVDSMSDLFHKDVPFEFVDRCFAVMALCPQHTFQVLTKRPERMAEYFSRGGVGIGALSAMAELAPKGMTMDQTCLNIVGGAWRLPNVWLGTSVEDQTRADERIPHLLRCPAAVRFLSVEPMLGPVDLSAFFGGQYVGLPGDVVHPNYNFGIGWVICGGESGPNARPLELAWVRPLRDRCRAAGVPFFMKQLGALVHYTIDQDGGKYFQRTKARKGGDMSEWPADLRVREMPRTGAAT